MQQNASFKAPLVVQRLKVHTSSASGMGSIPGGGTKIPYTTQHGKKKKKINENDKMLALSLAVGIFCESLPLDSITEVIK